MQNALHFVGFQDNRFWTKRNRDATVDRYNNAVRIFGEPDFIHRRWDVRAAQEVAPGDTVVFANGDGSETPEHPSFDDSQHF